MGITIFTRTLVIIMTIPTLLGLGALLRRLVPLCIHCLCLLNPEEPLDCGTGRHLCLVPTPAIISTMNYTWHGCQFMLPADTPLVHPSSGVLPGGQCHVLSVASSASIQPKQEILHRGDWAYSEPANPFTIHFHCPVSLSYILCPSA